MTKTKEELAQEYCEIGRTSQSVLQVREQTFAALKASEMGCTESQEKRLRLFFEKEMTVLMDAVKREVMEIFDEEELRWLIEMQKNPIYEKMQTITPKLFDTMMQRMSVVIAVTQEIVLNPGKIDEILPS